MLRIFVYRSALFCRANKYFLHQPLNSTLFIYILITLFLSFLIILIFSSCYGQRQTSGAYKFDIKHMRIRPLLIFFGRLLFFVLGFLTIPIFRACFLG